MASNPNETEDDSSRNRKRRKMEHIAEEEVEIDPIEVYNLTPWAEEVTSKTYENAEDRLHEEIVAYVNYVQPTTEESALRERVFLAVQAVVKQRFSYAEVKKHGSAATGLSLPGGDIDVCVSMTCHSVKGTLYTLRHALKDAGLTDNVQVKAFARVPIATFATMPEYGSVSVDLGINNDDGITSINIIKEYMEKMPALKPLVLVIKGFLKQRGLANPSRSGIGSYATILMCISFLQLNPTSRPEEFLSDPFKSRSLGFLLSDFMFYYGFQFPYTTSYISVQDGKLIPKDDLEWIDNRVENRLVVQCLLNREHDVSKSLNADHMERLVEAFKAAHADITQTTLQSPVGLGRVISMNQKMVDYRQHIKDIVGQGQIEELPIDWRDLNRQATQGSSYARGSSSYGSYNRSTYQGAPPPRRSRYQGGYENTGGSLLSRIQMDDAGPSRGYGRHDGERNQPEKRIYSGGRYDDRQLGMSRHAAPNAAGRDHGRRDVEYRRGGREGRIGALRDVVSSVVQHNEGRRAEDRDRSDQHRSRQEYHRRPETLSNVVSSAIRRNEGRKRDEDGRRKEDDG